MPAALPCRDDYAFSRFCVAYIIIMINARSETVAGRLPSAMRCCIAGV
jgi:hypothetical protein